MTDAQAVQIKELRMQGMGYRTIAETVGLTRDIVRNYCKANDMAGYELWDGLGGFRSWSCFPARLVGRYL